MGFQCLFSLLLLILPLVVTAEIRGWEPITNTSDPKVIEIAEFSVAAYNEKYTKKLVFQNVIQGKTVDLKGGGRLYEMDLNAKDESTTAKYEVDHRRHTATLDFGEAVRFRKAAGRRVQTAAILRTPEGRGSGLDYYFLNLTTITVEDIPLPIDQEIFSSSQGGFVIHSATPYSLFVAEAYRKIHQAVVDLYSDKFGSPTSKVRIWPLLPTPCGCCSCPSMKLHFEGGEEPGAPSTHTLSGVSGAE
ncbi:hypothetical protein M0R45_034774 [Rubus argutus]|uniref:Uncharacterized protein n=1 Tax=Rubus argutus TaxID=59490 RepID=A0AAW1VVK6_RUBAR